MLKGFFALPNIQNEPIKNYALGSTERKDLKNTLNIYKSTQADLPMIINGKEVRTNNTSILKPPHQLSHTLGQFYIGNQSHVTDAINAAIAAKNDWELMNWESRAAIFLKAADLIAGPYRYKINAATMLGQSKNAYQAEIDSACELIDFLRFNVQYMTQIYAQQPASSLGIWNRLEYRPLEGFVFALTPFNFTAIAGNLPASPALMGNTVVWKPAFTQVLSAQVIMEVFMEAGLPDGVINLIHTDGPTTGNIVFNHPQFAGLHFTGSTSTFNLMYKTIANNLSQYKSYPRIVGETGGKDFVVAHPSADPNLVAVALARGAFEYQGQKCSAASRAYIAKSIWNEVKNLLLNYLAEFKIGIVDDFRNFINAVIDEKSFDKITSYIDKAKNSSDAQIIAGGGYDKQEGYFIEPTIILTQNPYYTTMCEEIFGPVLTIYIYEDKNYEQTLNIVDKTSPYALTGSILSTNRKAIETATLLLRNAAGNFYINDKPTGAVVNQQPFGGARASGTNDKAGSYLNLTRWVSARAIKETLVPPTHYSYPFMEAE